MNIKKEVIAVAMAMFSLSAAGQQAVDYVNPIIGTNGMGHTFPGACTPFGWVQLSPDTDTIPHNVDGVYQKKPTSIAPVINTGTRRLSASAIRI